MRIFKFWKMKYKVYRNKPLWKPPLLSQDPRVAVEASGSSASREGASGLRGCPSLCSLTFLLPVVIPSHSEAPACLMCGRGAIHKLKALSPTSLSLGPPLKTQLRSPLRPTQPKHHMNCLTHSSLSSLKAGLCVTLHFGAEHRGWRASNFLWMTQISFTIFMSFPLAHPTPLSPKFPYMQRGICLSIVVEFSKVGMTASSLE